MCSVVIFSPKDDGRQALLVSETTTNLEMDPFFSAELKGAEGADFLTRLQRIWFISKAKGLSSIEKQTTRIAGTAIASSFPTEVRNAVNLDVNPCEDFYEFACGKWDADNHRNIPKYSTSWSLSWDPPDQKIQENMISILATDPGPAGMFYRSCMDTERIEKLGIRPIKPWLDLVDSIVDHKTLLHAVVEFNKANFDVLFTWYVDTNPKKNEERAFFLAQGGLSLPDQTYYTEDSPEMKAHRATFVQRVAAFFRMLGRPDAEREAALVLQLETALAHAHDDRTKAYKEHSAESSWEQMEAACPAWPWRRWLASLAACTPVFNRAPQICTEDHAAVAAVGSPGGKPLLLDNKDFWPKLSHLLQTQPLDNIKAAMRWQVVMGSASSLTRRMEDELLLWYKDLYGVKERSKRQRKCFNSATSTVGWASAKLYSDKLFEHENIQAAETMLEAIRAEFRGGLEAAEWMSPASRDAAKFKLSSMFFQVGVPTDKEGKVDWPDRIAALDGLVGPDYFYNTEVSSRVAIERTMKDLTGKTNRRSWGGSTPLEVNAFYGPSSNGLWIPAGILQDPFFSFKNSDARNYGAIGTILGHEMSHGFDDDGRQYDAKGELRDWWDAETVQGFKNRSGCISRLFDRYKVDGHQVNGRLTLGEDIADSGGIKFSYQAFLRAGGAKGRSAADRRLFFASFAQNWCEVERTKSAVSSVLTDEHAPGKFRVIGGVTQFPPFADAFSCPPGAPMAPPPPLRCELW